MRGKNTFLDNSKALHIAYIKRKKMENIADSNLPLLEVQASDELADDDLEQVSGGLAPLAIAGIAIGAVAVGTFAIGVVKGAMDGETEEADRCHGRK